MRQLRGATHQQVSGGLGGGASGRAGVMVGEGLGEVRGCRQRGWWRHVKCAAVQGRAAGVRMRMREGSLSRFPMLWLWVRVLRHACAEWCGKAGGVAARFLTAPAHNNPPDATHTNTQTRLLHYPAATPTPTPTPTPAACSLPFQGVSTCPFYPGQNENAPLFENGPHDLEWTNLHTHGLKVPYRHAIAPIAPIFPIFPIFPIVPIVPIVPVVPIVPLHLLSVDCRCQRPPQVDPGAVSLINICQPGQPTAGFPAGSNTDLTAYYCSGNTSSAQLCQVCVCVCGVGCKHQPKSKQTKPN